MVLFDGGCGFCRDWVAWVQDRGARVRFEPCAAWPGRRAAGITEADCQRTVWWIGPDGTKRSGAAAANRILGAMPLRRHRLAGRIGRLPVVAQLQEGVYRLVARNRHRLRGPGRRRERRSD